MSASVCTLARAAAASRGASCVYVHRPSTVRQAGPAAAATRQHLRPFVSQNHLKSGRGRATIGPCHATSKTLYEVLGVSEQATQKEIKTAYRKKAMKLHPDVNKAPDAKEQFMECKTAYDTLIDEKSRAQYDRARMGGSGFGIGGDFGTDWDSFGKYARDAAQATTYSYNDLIRDLDKEIESWQKEREKKKGKRAEDISDVVGDIAEEFLEFLEMEAGISGGSKGSKSSGGKDDADSGSYRSSSSSNTQTNSGSSSYSSSYSSSRSTYSSGGPKTRTTGTQTDEQGRTREEDVAERARRQAQEAAARAARIAEIEAERLKREAQKAGEVEDELAALKKKLGL